MFKRRLNAKMLTLFGVLLLAVCVSAFAGLRDGSWEVNPAAFRYDMSLYFGLADKDFEDLDKYEIGAFVGDECRGIAEKLELTEGESCLYMRIRSNKAADEVVDFLLRDRQTGDTVILKPRDGSDFLFKSGSRVGMPSDPFVMARFFNVSVKAGDNGSVDFADGLYAAGTVLNIKAVPDNGYALEAWSNGAKDETVSITVDGNLDLTATFAPNIYKVVFTVDGEEIYTIDVPYGSTITAPEAPAKPGYTFAGWEGLPETMPAGDIQVNGIYTANTYKLTFKVDNEVIFTADLEYEAPISVPADPVKEGYSFNGWGEVPAVMPAHDVEIHGSFSINSYKLVFVIDGQEISSSEVAYGSAVVAPDAPVKEGYSFNGWTDLPASMPASDVTVTGSYTVNSYKLVFKVDGEEISSQTVEFGSPVNAPAVPEKVGYTFAGWGEIPSVMPAHDVEVHGTFNINYYKLTFVLDGEELSSSDVAFGSAIVTPDVPVKDGYEFVGWTDVPESMPASDVQVVGTYKVKTYVITFKIDNEVILSSELEYGASISAPEAPAKEGYTFAGWSEFPSTMPDHNVDVVGSYTVNLYHIAFLIDGLTIEDLFLPYGASIVAPVAPAKEGHTFAGWEDVPAVMPAEDLRINGSYSVNKYRLSFRIGEELIQASEVEYGSAIVEPDAPEKEGYTFSGWSDYPETMPAADVQVVGAYNVNYYTITFKVDGEVLSSESLAYGSSIVAPDAPLKDGYSFSGWGEVPATMPASDLELSGEYSVNKYKLTFMIGEEVLLASELEYGAAISAPDVPAKEGHTFTGWNEHPDVMPAHDVMVVGAYNVNNYTITFSIDGAVLVSESLAYGASIVAPDAPVREGYSFNGWGEVPASMPASDVAIEGSYTVNKYKLVFRIGEEVLLSSEVEFGSEIALPEVPGKEGYAFAGWSEHPSVMPAHDLDVVGSYNVNLYTITFTIDGETILSESLPYGASIVAPDAPAREGYSFSGWGEVPSVMPASDLAFEGSYQSGSYKVVYMVDGETLYSADVAFGDKVPEFEAPEKTGYTFSGWGEIPSSMPAADLVFNGTYTANNYNLTFRIGDEVIFAGQLPYGSEIVAPEAPAKEGYTFQGWKDVPATMPASDLVVESAYSINSYTITFRIGDEVIYTAQLEYGAAIEAPDAPVVEGHAFSGWGDVPATMPAFDLSFGGTYAENFYTVTFRIDGVVLFTDDIEYGDPVNVPDAPEREGYSFNGWGDVPATMPASNLVFDGSYNVNTYAVTFRIGDEVVYTGVLPYGAEISAPEVAAKEGHTFDGWGVVPPTMPASDLEVIGSYTVNSYTVTFQINGVAFHSVQVPYGSEITAPEAPAMEGYSFVGWGDLPASMPASDLVIDGTYSINSYAVTFRIGDEVIFSGQLPYGAEVSAPEAPAKEGYTFTGWGMVPATMPASDIEVVGAYDVNLYTLTFLIDGADFYTVQVPYGASISAPEAPGKEGHSFVGWADMPAFMPASNLVISGTYALNNYNVVFRIGEEIVFEGSLPYGSDIVVPDAPAKDGYTFTGWGMVPATVPASDIEVVGAYDINVYNVTFLIDGVAFYTAQVPYGAPVVVPEAPGKEGYSFLGWSDVPASMPASDLIVSGSYAVNSYTAVFRIGDDVIFEGQLPYGAEIVVPSAPAKEGYTFAGWGMVPATMPASDIEVVGSYDVNMYNVTFSIDGAEYYTAQLPYGADIVAPAVPEKEGYSFIGWADVPAVMPASDLLVSGTYAVNSYKAIFRIDDQIVFEGELPYGSEIVAPAAPAKDGHTFAGWGMMPSVMPASDIEVVGSYDVNVYTLTFTIDGSDFYTAQVPYGTEIAVPEVPAKEGHSFIGWTDVPAVMPASDLAFAGTYTINNYKVLFRIGDEVIYEGLVPYNTEVITPAAPVVEGHTFAGWGMVPDLMPASDLEFVGSYDVNVYNLTYRIDGIDFYTTQIAYGSELPVVEAPAKEGHSFLGWSENVAVMPASDLVISGSYAINNYTVSFRIGDEEVYVGLVPYGSEIVVPAAPVKEGHTFAGWGMVPAVMPAFDLEFVGSYDVNVYTLTFDIDGEVFYQTQLAYGSEIVAPAEVPDKEGNSFGGWGNVPSSMPANDVTVSGTYAANHYTVTFRIGDEIVFTGEQPFGSEIIVPAAPEKEGYTFAGWGDVPATVPASNVEFNGVYTANEYTLSFYVDGIEISSSKVAYGQPIEVPAVDYKEGYLFSGFGVIPTVMPASDLAFHGIYEINHYKVVFKVGEEVIYTASVPYGSDIDVPSAPEREGFTFVGWGEVPAVMPASDLSFEAEYTVNEYTLTFRLGDEVIYSEKVPFGTEVVAPEVPAKEGYAFGGWGVVPAVMPASDVEISGVYEVLYYSLSFSIGEDVVYSAMLPYGAEIVAPEAPAKEGHEFSGWGEVPAVMPAHDIAFTGSYGVDTYTVTFRIGDDVIFSGSLEFGAEISVPEAPAKEGYTFTGWGVVPAVMPASDLVVNGAYEINSYSLVFRIGEEVILSAQVSYGAEIVAPAAPEREGHSFSGWGNVPDTMPASDLEFTGAYDTDKYQLTFMIGDEVVYSAEVAYGAEIVAPEASAKEGYTFTGWGVVPAVMPASDLTVTGAYELNSYSLVFRIGDEVIVAAQVPYGAEIVVPAAPEREGHTFLGWGDVPAVMPASDLEFTGAYDTDKYQLTFMIGDEVVYSAEVAYGAEIVAPEASAKEGYTFTGWGVVPAVMPASDLTVTGAYELNSYSLVFRIGDEVIVAAQVPYGAEIVVPAAPEREGHTFLGWGDVPAVMPASDLEFTGAYDTDKYQLTFMIGDEVVYSAEVAYGAEIVAPEASAKEGYTFTGWGVVPAVMPASDLTVTGAYELNSYTVVFRIGEEIFHTAILPYGAEIVAPVAPEKEGHTFTGWGEVPAVMPASDLAFTGSYDVNSYKLVFTVDGVVVYESLVEFGSEISVPQVADKVGYTFSGFGVVPAVMPASDLAFSGAYEVNSYNVTFKVNDNVVYSAQLPYGAEIVAPEAPSAEGCTFSGWSEYPSVMPASDVEVTGTLTPNFYRLLVYVNDKVYIDEEVAFGTELVIPDPEVEENQKFEGWKEEIPATMPAHDLVIHGTVVDEGTVSVDGVLVGDDLTIYTTDGVLLYKNVKASEIKERLTPGVYIVNGLKMVVR